MARSTQRNRRKLIIIVLVIAMTANVTVVAKEPEWFIKIKQIDVLKSTRIDVERVFPESKIVDQIDYTEEKGGWGREVEYRTSEGYLKVEYSTEGCPVNKLAVAYNVPLDTVVELRFYPSDEPSITELDLRLDDFSRERVADVVDTFVFRNVSRGTKLVISKGKVSSVEFSPARLHERRRCMYQLPRTKQVGRGVGSRITESPRRTNGAPAGNCCPG